MQVMLDEFDVRLDCKRFSLLRRAALGPVFDGRFRVRNIFVRPLRFVTAALRAISSGLPSRRGTKAVRLLTSQRADLARGPQEPGYCHMRAPSPREFNGHRGSRTSAGDGRSSCARGASKAWLVYALLLCPVLAHAGDYGITRGKWLLYKGETQLGPYATEWECADAAATLNITGSYSCRTTTGVDVIATTTPTVKFTVTPTSIKRGSGTVLSWSSTYATKCESTGPSWFGMPSTTSGAQWAFPEIDAEYAVTCTGPDGVIASPIVVVRVAAP